MSLSDMVTQPFIAIFGIIIIIIIVILSIPTLAGITLVGSTNSANLTSAGGALSELLPWFALLVAGGITILVIGGSRR